MTENELKEIALFKFSLIAPIVSDTYEAASISGYLRDVASKTHVMPNGKSVNYSPGAIKKWYQKYKTGGFDALIPRQRSDAGTPRVMSSDAINKLKSLKQEFPYITGTLVYHKLVEEGYIKASETSLASILRYIRDNNLSRNQLAPVERKAFEMAFSNDCWQSDSSHGPVIVSGGHKRHTFLITTLDDASRMITHGEFFFNDNAINMQLVLKKAIAKYGLPKRLYVDNGSSYRNDQLRLICASLGVVLIHTPAYSPQNKGKIERSFRTIKDNWMHGINWNDFDSLDSLNTSFNQYLTQHYSNTVHSSLNLTPRERYLKDTELIKFLPIESLDEHFLHRVTRRVNNDATIQLYNKLFEVPQKFIGQKINIRYCPTSLDKAFIYNKDNQLTDTVFPLRKVDNSKVKRSGLDYSLINGGDLNA